MCFPCICLVYFAHINLCLFSLPLGVWLVATSDCGTPWNLLSTTFQNIASSRIRNQNPTVWCQEHSALGHMDASSECWSAWRQFFNVNKTIIQARDCAFMKMSEADQESLKISIPLSESVFFFCHLHEIKQLSNILTYFFSLFLNLS